MSILVLLPAYVALAQPLLKPDLDAVTPARIRSHVRFLANDLLKGRNSPSEGLDLAAEYIAGEFEKLGLKPGNGDSYFQITEHTSRRGNTAGKVRNVVAVVPGRDAKLKDEFILVTAHYDHLGVREGEGDRLYNGANDNASGTAGVIEVANALKAANCKRTIVFMCFWGEEQGLLGARHYAKEPIFPLVATIANVNLEQIGRTDDSEGPRVAEFNVTGFDFTDMPAVLLAAARGEGVQVTKHEKNSDPYFFASDNAALAQVGVPAHTISVAYSFPDYHQPGDEWQKLDYPNTVKIVRAISLGVMDLANRAERVKWNESHPRTAKFVEAWKKLSGGTP